MIVERRGQAEVRVVAPLTIPALVQAIYRGYLPPAVVTYVRRGNNGKLLETRASEFRY